MNIFDSQAALYKKRVGTWLSIARGMRKELLNSAKGRVLEIACGAGANFPFYPTTVESIVAVDGSLNMVEAARENAKLTSAHVEVLQSPIESLLLPVKSFDTIVSTLSLCSYGDPVQVISHVKEFAKPDAVFLFLEHGKSPYSLIQGIQNRWDSYHFGKKGCHLNRDIEKVITDAGLVIERRQVKLFGIIRAIVARAK